MTTNCQLASKEAFVSYSLNFEDVILHRIFKERTAGFFVDVGAGHPMFENDTRALYERGWRGINIEPNPGFFQELHEQRPDDQNVNLALSDEEGVLSYNEVVGTGLSTFDPVEAERCRRNGHHIIERQVRSTTLTKLLTEIAPPATINLLKVDVEGFEYKVLAGNDWQRFRPLVIVVEATFPERPERRPTQIRQFLEARDYRVAYFDGLNDFYIETSFDLPPNIFDAPPNIFDRFITLPHSKARGHAANLEKMTCRLRSEADVVNQRIQAAERDYACLKLAHERVLHAREELSGRVTTLEFELDCLNRQTNAFQLGMRQAGRALTLLRPQILDRLRRHPQQISEFIGLLNDSEAGAIVADDNSRAGEVTSPEDFVQLIGRIARDSRTEALVQENTSLRFELDDLRAEVTRLRSSIRAQTERGRQLSHDLASLKIDRAELETLRARLQAMSAGLAQADEQAVAPAIPPVCPQACEKARLYDAVLRSTSWRITAPMRAVSNALRWRPR